MRALLRKVVVILIFVWFSPILYAQLGNITIDRNIYGWVVKDEMFQNRFIEAYQAIDDYTTIQKYYSIYVYVKITNNQYELKEIQALEPDDLVFDSFNMELINQELDPSIIDELLNRKYSWDDIDFTAFENIMGGTFNVAGPINIFQRKNHKTARDLFWWSHRMFEINFANSIVWRVQNKPLGFLVNLGDNDMGYPSPLSQSINFGICNEVIKGYVSAPMKPFYKITENESIEGGFGVGLQFDSYRIGGTVIYKDPAWMQMKAENLPDPDNIIFSKWFSQIFISTTLGVPSQKIKSMTLLSKSTLRPKFGVAFHKLLYGGLNSNEQYQDYDETDLMETVNVFFRFDWLSDLDKNKGFINKWKMATQIKFNLAGQKSFYTHYSYSLTKVLRVGLYVGYVGPIEFNIPMCDESHIWEPGFFVSPTISFITG